MLPLWLMLKTRPYLFIAFISWSALACNGVSAHELTEPCITSPIDNDVQITLYPNPFKANLQLDLVSKNTLTSVEIKFLNLIGKEMDVKFNLQVDGMNNHLELDLKQLPAGVYFMEITTRQLNGSFTKYTRKVTKL